METKTINEVSISEYMFEDGLINKVSGDKLNIKTDWVNFFFSPKFQILNVFLNDEDKMTHFMTELDELYTIEFKEIAKKFHWEQVPLIKSYVNKNGENVKFLKFNLKKCLVFDDTGKRINIPDNMKGYQVRLSFVINTFNMNRTHGVSLRPLQIQLRKRPVKFPEVITDGCLFD